MNKTVSDIWNDIKEEVMEYLKDTEILSLIAHGSFAEGIANRTSDFDLLVVCGESVEERIEVVVIHDIEVDIDFLHKETLVTQLESLDDLLKPGLMPPFASRLKNAVILMDTDDTGKELVDMARQFEPSAQLTDEYSRLGLSYYYDAVGAMASGDYATSIHMARIGAVHVLAGILLNSGELYVNKKWFIELLNKNPSAPKELFLQLMGLDNADKEQAYQCIRELNRLISEFQHMREKDR